MKQILLSLALLYLISCATIQHEDRLGPAQNIEDRGESTLSCEERYVYQDGKWVDDVDGVSDCVDLHLYSQNKKLYYDKCCYVRFQIDGEMHAGCVGLTQEQLIDTTETIRKMEEGDRTIWTSYAANSKIYQLDCNSSYLKLFSLIFVFLGLLL